MYHLDDCDVVNVYSALFWHFFKPILRSLSSGYALLRKGPITRKVSVAILLFEHLCFFHYWCHMKLILYCFVSLPVLRPILTYGNIKIIQRFQIIRSTTQNYKYPVVPHSG